MPLKLTIDDIFTNSVFLTVDGTSSVCRLWLGGASRKGYGKCGKSGDRVHRVVWRLKFGPIPEGMWVLHRCDNPVCCEPSHLFLGTNDDNIADKMLKGRHRLPVGELHGNAKLTEALVLRIKADLESGITQRRIATMYGISQPSVSKIKHHNLWKHLGS